MEWLQGLLGTFKSGQNSGLMDFDPNSSGGAAQSGGDNGGYSPDYLKRIIAAGKQGAEDKTEDREYAESVKWQDRAYEGGLTTAKIAQARQLPNAQNQLMSLMSMINNQPQQTPRQKIEPYRNTYISSLMRDL